MNVQFSSHSPTLITADWSISSWEEEAREWSRFSFVAKFAADGGITTAVLTETPPPQISQSADEGNGPVWVS